MYIALAIPNERTPAKSLIEIKAFGERILGNYTKPIGKGISKTSLENILQFLDEQYSFCSKVFAKQKAAFVLMPISHKVYNSECLIINTGDGIVQHFFLYHMRDRGCQHFLGQFSKQVVESLKQLCRIPSVTLHRFAVIDSPV